MTWAEEFKPVQESWPQCTPQCFCDTCRVVIEKMLNCAKCLSLRGSTCHSCGLFCKDFGIFVPTPTHKAFVLHAAALLPKASSGS